MLWIKITTITITKITIIRLHLLDNLWIYFRLGPDIAMNGSPFSATVSASTSAMSLKCGSSGLSSIQSLTGKRASTSLSLRSLNFREDNSDDYREAFNAFDWNKSGKISYGSLQVAAVDYINCVPLN